MEIRKQVLQTYVTSILYYFNEAWRMNKRIKKQLEATEVWFWRRMLKARCTDIITNEDTLKQVNEKMRIKERNNRDSPDTF
jgi:hypothetical protein